MNLIRKFMKYLNPKTSNKDDIVENRNAHPAKIMKGFKINMALFCLKMYAKHLLPSSVIQNIIEQFQEINIEVAAISTSQLQEKLNLLSIHNEIINNMLHEFNNKILFKELNDLLDTIIKECHT